jgi:hypothetical protein
MKNIYFENHSVANLLIGLQGGISGYTTVSNDNTWPVPVIILRLCDGRILLIQIEMQEVDDWEEVGALIFKINNIDNIPSIIDLPNSWNNIIDIKKFIYEINGYAVECGFRLTTFNGDELIILPGDPIFTLAIKAPFIQEKFNPEYDIQKYICNNWIE